MPQRRVARRVALPRSGERTPVAEGSVRAGAAQFRADPRAARREILDAHRRGDVQPHSTTEEVIDALLVGAREALDERDETP